MKTDFHALCAQLLAHAERAQSVAAQDLWFGDEDDGLFDRARAALAQPEPEGPAVWTEGICGDGAALLRDGVMVPIEEVVQELNEGAQARAVLARWGRATPQPVPVSERLPGPELCWWYEPDEDDDGSGYGGSWTLLRIRGNTVSYTHWLPFHALPLPTSGEGE